jgi:hypothetical protein
MDLIEQSSLDVVFDEHIKPLIKIDGNFKSTKTRIGLIRGQLDAAYKAYQTLSNEDKASALIEAESKLEKKKSTFRECTWPIWSSPLCEIFRYLPPNSVQDMMIVCSHWRREGTFRSRTNTIELNRRHVCNTIHCCAINVVGERNRIWRPLVCKYYPTETLEVEDVNSHSYRRWRMRWLALRQYSRVAVKISYVNFRSYHHMHFHESSV